MFYNQNNNMNYLVNSLNFNQIVFRGCIYRQSNIQQPIDSLANYLNKKIKSSSPFVVLTAYNHIKTVIAYYAILKAGKIAVLLDPGCKSLEIAEILEDVDPSSIIFLNTTTISFNYDEEVIFRTQKSSFIIKSDLKDVCTVVYTNGEDGYAKGAMLTEKNLITEIESLKTTVRLDHTSFSCALLPFSHLYGLLQGVLVPTHCGGNTLISELDLNRLPQTIKDIQIYRVTHMFTIPSIYYILAKVPGIEKAVTNIKNFYSGGTKLPLHIFENFYRKTNRKIREGYGLTESSPGCILNYQEEDPNIESIGKSMPGCEIKILDVQNNECKTETIGEICVKGDLVFQGYFNYEETTKQVIRQGWLHTGDYGKKDKNNFIYYCGLKKDMINVAGNNVYPKRLERMMSLNQNVYYVKVSGEDSILQGQIVHAQIKLLKNSEKTRNDYKKWCLKNINNTTLPKHWQFE